MGMCFSMNSPSVPSLLSNKTTNDNLISDVKDILKDHSNLSDVQTTVNQSVTIRNTNSDPRNPLYSMTCQNYWPWGLKKGLPNPIYGCGYEVKQNADIKIVTLNQDVSDRSEEIYNQISSSIQKDFDAELSGDEGGRKLMNDTLSSAKDDAVQNISDYLNNEATKEINENQSITIEYDGKLLCPGDCGDNTPYKIDQEVMVEVVATNIINIVKKEIKRKMVENGVESKLEFDSNVDKDNTEALSCMGYYVGAVIIILFCLFIIYKLLTSGGGSKPGLKVRALKKLDSKG